MKHTVLLLLLVTIVLAEPLTRDNKGRKSSRRSERKLLEGNYGLKIRPIDNGVQFTEDYSRNRQQKSIPSEEYGAPRQHLVPQVSDVPSTQAHALPVASHLHSPASASQPRYRFEISQPVPSQMLYSEHKMISDDFLSNHGFGPLTTDTKQENYEKKESFDNENPKYNPNPLDAQSIVNGGGSYEKQEDLIRNFESHKTNKISQSTGQSNGGPRKALRTQQESSRNLQSFESIKQAQLNLEPQTSTIITYNELQPTPVNLLHPILPRLLPYNHPSPAIYSHQLLQPIYPTEIQGFPPYFFQQINQLANQLTVQIETIDHAENEQANEEDEEKDSEKEFIEDLNQPTQRTNEQTSVVQAEVTSISPITSSQPQAVSYSRFSLGLPPPSNGIQLPLHVPLPSPTPPPQFQPLPQSQLPQLFVTPVSPQTIEQSTPRLILQPNLETIPQQFQPQQELFQETTPQPTIQPQLQEIPRTIPQATLQPLLQPIQSRLQTIQPQLQITQQTTPQPTVQPQLELFQLTTPQPTLKPQLQPIQPMLQPLQPQMQIVQLTTQKPTLQPALQPIQPQVEAIQQTIPQPTFQPLLQPILSRLQPIQPQLQITQQTTPVMPPKTLLTVTNQPRNRGLIRFRQRPTTSLRRNQQTLNTSFRNRPTIKTSSQSQQTLNTQEPVFSSTPLVVTTLNSQPLFTSQELNNFSDDVSTVATSIFPRSTESSSQQIDSSTTPASISIIIIIIISLC